MDGNVLAVLIGGLAAALAAVPGVLAYFNQRRAGRADVLERMTGAAVALVEPLQARLDALESENAELRLAVDGLERERARLEALLTDLTTRLESLQRANRRLTEAVRAYLKSPGRAAGRPTEKRGLLAALAQVENQTGEAVPPLPARKT